MSGLFKKEDLRILKTNNALTAAMSKLLKGQNFNQLTVNDICEQALISRSTFYSHFKDKYDLLEYWLTDLKSKAEKEECTYEDIEKRVNDFVNENKNMIKNLVENAHCETSELLCDFILSILRINIDRADKVQIGSNHVVLSSVCCGGILNYLLWQVNNKFPTELQVMNPYLYDLLLHFQKLGEGREYSMDIHFAEKEKQLQSLQSGKGIQYLLNEAYQIFGNPLSMHDMDDKMIAYTENVLTDDPYWNESVTSGTVSNDTLELFRTEYFIYDIANAKTVTFLISDKLKYDRIFGKIFINDNFRVANLSMIACNKPFEDSDPMMFEEFCKILSSEFSNIEYYQSYGKAYQEKLVSQMIDGSITDKNYYLARVEDIYKGLKPYLYLAVADIPPCDCECTKFEYFCALFKQAQPEFKYYIYSNYVVIIMSSVNMPLNAEREMGKLFCLFEQYHIKVGISSHFENLFELRKYYMEAVDALKHSNESYK